MILSTLQNLEWVVDEDLLSQVSDASAQLDSLDMDTDLEVFNFPGYGKEFIKSARCSPDAWLQMSLQLTMFRLILFTDTEYTLIFYVFFNTFNISL